jgi:hypothetical protein
VPVKIPAPELSGLSKIQEQFFIPDGGNMIRLSLQGDFSGKLLILQPKIFRIPSPDSIQEIKPVTAPVAPVAEPESSPVRGNDWAQ